MKGIVWIIGVKNHLSCFVLFARIQQERMVQRSIWKSINMDNGQPARFKFGGKVICRGCLTMTRYRKDHAPIAALEKTAPGSATFLLQHGGMGRAKFVQVRVTWDDNFIDLGGRTTAASLDNRANEPLISREVRAPQIWIETGVIKKFPRSPDHRKTMKGIFWRGLGAGGRFFSV